MSRKNHSYPDLKNIYLIIIIIIGLIIRLFTYPQVFEPGRVVFLEADPYYHMWRVFSYIEIFPKTFLFDPYINYPYGALIGWPPLFDQGIALVSMIAGLGNPGAHLVESIAAFTPVLMGVFSIIAVYYITKEIFNERVALYGSTLFAVMPAHSQISFLGFTDHQVAEVLLSVLAYLFFIRSLKDGSRRFAVISGILIGISFLTWIGAPIFTGILLSYAAVQFIFDRKSNIDPDYMIITGTVTFLAALFVMLVFYLWTPWQQMITSGALSYFQLIYLAISAVIILFLGAISNLMKRQKWYYYPFLIGIITTFLFLLLLLGIPSFYQGISGGIGYLLGDEPVLKQISEAQPLFYTYDGKFAGWQWDKNPVWYAFTFSFYTAVIGLVWFLYSYRNGIDKGKLFFAAWTLINLVLALFQRRFAYMLAVNIAILSGFLIYEIIEKTRSLKSYHKMKTFVITIFILFLFIPNIAVSYDLSRSPPKPSDDWYDSLTWLKENTPDTGNDPQYGIMTWWDYGNWILYISRRPVVANNFQIGGDDAAKFFLADNETAANSIMETRKTRYVVVDRKMGLNKFIQGDRLVLMGTFFAVASFAGKDIAQYLDKYNLPNEKYFQTMYARMHVLDGNGLRNYRMIYESNETHPDLFNKQSRNIKFYEYLNGAKIAGNVSRGEIVSISGTIITNQKRLFDYNQTIKADEKGHFELIVPYSDNGPYRTRLLKDYSLKFANSTHSIKVSENDVMNGNIIMVNQ